MEKRPRGRVGSAARWLGLVSTEPKPTPREAFRAFLLVLPLVIIAGLAAGLVEHQGGPEWLSLLLIVVPIWVAVALMQRMVRQRK